MTARCALPAYCPLPAARCLLIRPQNLPELQRVDVAEHRRSEGRAAAEGRVQSCVVLRKVLTPLSPTEAMELLLSKMSKAKTNGDFLAAMASGKS